MHGHSQATTEKESEEDFLRLPETMLPEKTMSSFRLRPSAPESMPITILQMPFIKVSVLRNWKFSQNIGTKQIPARYM